MCWRCCNWRLEAANCDNLDECPPSGGDPLVSYYDELQGIIGTVLMALAGEPLMILELMAR